MKCQVFNKQTLKVFLRIIIAELDEEIEIFEVVVCFKFKGVFLFICRVVSPKECKYLIK